MLRYMYVSVSSCVCLCAAILKILKEYAFYIRIRVNALYNDFGMKIFTYAMQTNIRILLIKQNC